MSEVTGCILDDGKSLITSSLTGFSLFAPVKYVLGSSYGFTPDSTDSAIRGDVVYEGTAYDVTARSLSTDTARYVITVPEDIGPFTFGNCVLYCSTWTADPVAMFSVVLPFAYTKEKSTATSSSGEQYPVPGNRFLITITLKHSVTADVINVTVETPSYSSLPYYKDETSYPPPALNPWTTFVLHNDSRTNMPVMVTTRDDGSQWGIPCWQSIRDPKFGIADGGQCGDAYSTSALSYIWGQRYTTSSDDYSGTIGGTSYTLGEGNFIGNLGGQNYVL